MATIFHLALASDWAAAHEAGAYTISTRGRTLAEEGFIHASRGDQWPKVRELLLRRRDRAAAPAADRHRPARRTGHRRAGEPGANETFPHIYGPIALDAVVKAMPVPARGDDPVPATATAPATRSGR